MNKFIYCISSAIITLIVTFLLFELLSWYHLGDAMTNTVLVRFVIVYLVLTGITISVIAIVFKNEKVLDK